MAVEEPLGVGVLYVVYRQTIDVRARADTAQRAKATALNKYLLEAASSARTLCRLNPDLRVALSTTRRNLTRQVRTSFSVILQLADAKPTEPLWAPRLRALANSPFYLTLALDSHATACSPQLHAALLREAARRGAYDLAVNFEAAACLPTAPAGVRSGVGRIYAPSHHSELLPHNWALLLRQGPGLRALLGLWYSMLERMRQKHQQPDDQWALALALRRLHRTGGCVGSAHHSPSREGSSNGGSAITSSDSRGLPPSNDTRHKLPRAENGWIWRRSWSWGRKLRDAAAAATAGKLCNDPVRVWRLGEAFAAFKSADKRNLGFFPRYTRLLNGPVLATHQLRPYPWSKGRGFHSGVSDACTLFNERVGVPRLAILSAKRDRVRMVYNESACSDTLSRHASAARAKRIAAPVCRMLLFQALPGHPNAAVAEPMRIFWRRLQRARGSL